MNKIFSISIFIILSFNAIAQNAKNEDDSVSTNTYFNRYINYFENDPQSQIVRPEFLFTISKFDTTQNGEIWLKTKLAVTNGIKQNDFASSSYLLEPYYKIYMESKGISLFRKVLGMAKLGAVGYMAYKHIKKYGLFH